jgi:NAD(P)-dependent dehydrogenase (short-subunit alcohol dehydrogenase family)
MASATQPKKILITGTSKGIGFDAALYFARLGHEVIATMRTPANSTLGEAAAAESLPVRIIPMDVDSEDSVTAAFAEAGEIDVLINNAGILSYDTIEEESQETIEAVMNTNYFGVVRCSKAVIPMMRARGSGCIINIGSVAGTIAIPCSAAYSSSKFALEAFSEVLAQELRPFSVRVHLVKPGIIDTPMATTEFPAPRSDSAYPHGRRVKALFGLASHIEAPAELVSEKLRYLVESNDDRLRHPVGPDSLQFLGYRASVDDERFIAAWGTGSDDEFLTKTRSDMMLDLGPFLEPE